MTTLAQFESALTATKAPAAMQNAAQALISAIWGPANKGITVAESTPGVLNVSYLGAKYDVTVVITAAA